MSYINLLFSITFVPYFVNSEKKYNCPIYFTENLVCTGNNASTKDYGPEFGLIVRYSGNKGFGVFATKIFYPGDLITQYRGFLTDDKLIEDEAYNEPINQEIPNVFEVEYSGRIISLVNSNNYADGIGRLINHSRRKPNAESQQDEEFGYPAINIYAITLISPGQEILMDYHIYEKDKPWLYLS